MSSGHKRENRPYQRKGAISNAHVGREFEARTQDFFASQGIHLAHNVAVPVGVSGTRPHNFDLGDTDSKVLVECKAHTWTEGDNVPSAKITSWNQAMYYFHAAPPGYRKIMFVLRNHSAKRNETLAAYYLRTNGHLIPEDVELWEYDDSTASAAKIN